MPYFKWRGIDLSGSEKSGLQFARTRESLEKMLFQSEIAILVADIVPRQRWFRAPSVSRGVLADFFDYLSCLLKAGVRLDEALDLSCKTLKSAALRSIMIDCASAVREGVAFSVALGYHAPDVDSMVIAVVEAGEESGALTLACSMLSIHYKIHHELAQKLRSSLAMPLLTLVFFCIITVGVFLAVIPRFESLFAMLNKPVPLVTQALFSISSFMRSSWFIVACCMAIALVFIGIRLCVLPLFKRWRDRAIFSVPIIGTLTWTYSMTVFLQSLGVLLGGGVHLVKALGVSQKTINNSFMREALTELAAQVESGAPLSKSFAQNPFFKRMSNDLEALFAIGESTGDVTPLVKKATELYYDKTHRLLALIMRLIPPLMLLCLGALIALLIFAVYTPLLTFSKLIG